MKKFAKISLAAAVAVAGLSSVASAKPLEEAIKGVDATGFVSYQYNDTNTKNAANSTQDNIYKAGVTLTIPAADDVAMKVTGVARDKLDGDTDAKSNIGVVHANFVYTGVENLTVIAGKQAISTPWTQGSSHIDATQTGTGALALYNAGFATLAAGHMVSNNISAASSDAKVDVTANDITVAAIIAPLADVATAQVWYAKVGDALGTTSSLAEGANALNASLDVNLMDVAKLNVTYSELKGDNNSLKKQQLTKASLSGKVAMVGLTAAYATTDKVGGLVAFDSDGSAGFKGFQADVNSLADASVYLLKADANVTDSLNLALTYIDGDYKGTYASYVGATKTDISEWYAQATYNFSKNLSAYVRYGEMESKPTAAAKTETEKGRIEVAYKF